MQPTWILIAKETISYHTLWTVLQDSTVLGEPQDIHTQVLGPGCRTKEAPGRVLAPLSHTCRLPCHARM